ncbi:MAG: hypothetical protein ABI863_02935 [Ginsengibacter sp.]
METVLKVSPSELNLSLINKIKKLLVITSNVDITISLNEFNPAYANELERSVEQAENGQEIISMTMEEFVAYTPKKETNTMNGLKTFG